MLRAWVWLLCNWAWFGFCSHFSGRIQSSCASHVTSNRNRESTELPSVLHAPSEVTNQPKRGAAVHNRKFLFYAAALAGLVFAFASTTDAKQASWPVYRADALQYAANDLPATIVIFVYTSDARLVSILRTPRGTSNEQALADIGNMIANQSFTEVPEAKLASTAKSLKNFLLDQGYDVREIVSSKSKYTLVLRGWVVRTSDCDFFTDIQKRYKTLIRTSMPMSAGGEPTYSVAILKIGSPNQKLSCTTK